MMLILLMLIQMLFQNCNKHSFLFSQLFNQLGWQATILLSYFVTHYFTWMAISICTASSVPPTTVSLCLYDSAQVTKAKGAQREREREREWAVHQSSCCDAIFHQPLLSCSVALALIKHLSHTQVSSLIPFLLLVTLYIRALVFLFFVFIANANNHFKT